MTEATYVRGQLNRTGGGGEGHRYRSPVERLEACTFCISALVAQKACDRMLFHKHLTVKWGA